MLISMIAAASINNVIGKDNKLIWRLAEDTKFFKNTTWGMPVIMGRKTFESMEGEPLPGRPNIVITRSPEKIPADSGAQVSPTLKDALLLAEETDSNEVFIIGGGEIYKEGMPLAQKIYLTRVETTIDGDAFFPEIDEKQWKLINERPFPADEKNEYPYNFQIWIRK